jgi:signal transduction histidine kinase
MTLRAKLGLLFLAALQVTFLTAVAAFWGMQSWQLLTDDLTLIHEQSLRLDQALDRAVREPGGTEQPELAALREQAQTVEEVERVGRLTAALTGAARGDEVRRAAADLRGFYHAEVGRLRDRAGFVTHLSSGLLVAIIVIVLGATMGYFAAMRVWLVQPIQALGAATRVIATGDLAHRIPVARDDELGALAGSINTMAASLARIQRELVTAERFAMIGEMSAYVAHNIRNPLASIRATAQTEIDALGAADPAREGLADIVRATDRLGGWVGDLLRFASPVALDSRPESLNALVERCLELTDARRAVRTLVVARALADALPDVRLDRNKIEQVVSAVLSNAFEASPQGATVWVSTRIDQPLDELPTAVVRIEDQGPGIPPERRRSVFALFGTNKRGGTGLGLSLSYKIVAAHQGTIVLGDRDGGGTTVEIRLPVSGQGSDGEHPHH